MSVKAVTTVSIAAVLDLLAQVVERTACRRPPGPPAGRARRLPVAGHRCNSVSSSGQSRVTSSSSSVRTGPVYLFFADTTHQIATSAPTTSTIGV